VNACVPTSTSNSLLWLNQKFGLFHGFPPARHDLVDTLSRYMKRKRKEGTWTDDMIRGKLNFIEARKLPLRVRYQVEKSYIDTSITSSGGNTYAKCSNTDDYPTWDFLMQAMKDSCDVEINYEATDRSGNVYAHSVVVTGLEQYDRAGLLYLDFKHDRDQKHEGGTRQESVQVWKDKDGRLRISGRKNAFIRDVVAECPLEPYKTAVEESRPNLLAGPELLANFPNPFNGSTVVVFRLPESAPVELSVYDALGRLVEFRDLGRMPAGENRWTWRAGSEPTGVYVLRLKIGPRVLSKKITLMR
jgi:hypothetical protein